MMQSAAPGALAGAAREPEPEPSPLPPRRGGCTPQAPGRRPDALEMRAREGGEGALSEWGEGVPVVPPTCLLRALGRVTSLSGPLSLHL